MGVTSAIMEGFKQTLLTCDCGVDSYLWPNTAQCMEFLNSDECDRLTFVIQEEEIFRRKEGCDDYRVRGYFYIRIYTPPGSGTHEARDMADCLLCCIKANSNRTFQTDDGASVLLTYSHGKNMPSNSLSGYDEAGRAVRIVTVPYDAFTCDC